MQSSDMLEDIVIEQAMRRAEQSGWTVAPQNCFVVGIASDEALRTGEPRAWIVHMSVHPFHNPRLQRPIRLECRVEWLGECLCTVELHEHIERNQQVIRGR